MKQLKHISLLLTFCTISLVAQMNNIEFQRYTTSDGLSTNWNISAIAQDKDGYIWIATSEGLNRFDGYDFKVFRYDPLNSNSLRTNNVTSLLIDSKNRFWLASFGAPNGGISQWNPKTETFINYVPENSDTNYLFPWALTKLYEDRSGNIWVGTVAGLDIFNPETGKYLHYTDKKSGFSSLVHNYITAIIEDSRGNLWIGTLDSGLVKYNPATKEYQRFQYDKSNIKSLLSNHINSIYEDPNGTLFIGTNLGGLHTYNYSYNSIVRLPDNSTDFQNLRAPVSKGPVFGQNGGIAIIKRTGDGSLWLGTSNGGIKVYDNNFSRFNLFINDPLHKTSLSDDYVTTIFEDNQNNIWLGTISRGLMKVVPSQSLFKPNGNNLDLLNTLKEKHIRAIYESNNGNLWVGTIDGLLLEYDPQKKIIQEFKSDLATGSKHKLSGPDIDAIYEDKEGIIWIGTFSGVDKYDPKKGTVNHTQVKYQNNINDFNIDIEAIIDADNENLWIAAWDWGVFKFNKKTTVIEYYGWKAFDSTSLSNNKVFTLFKSNKGDLWVGTSDGLNLFDNSAKIFKHFLMGTTVSSIQEDKKGIIWAGTNNGLYKLDLISNIITHYTKENGLPSNLIGGILTDKEDYLWIGTSAGLVRFNPRDKTFLKYDESDGAQSDLYETGNSYFKTKAGLLLFGSFDGITVFDPSKIKYNTNAPNVLIKGVNIFNSGGNSESAPKYWRNYISNSLTLNHNENELVFDYVGIHFAHPKRNTYQYKLEPYDQNWQPITYQRSARYTNLAPGDYTFKVKASNSDGIWSEIYASINITVLPPWWQTWWAYSLYFFGLIILLGGIRKFELDRRREKENKKLLQLENNRKTKELEEARNLQLSMLPKVLPQLPNLDIAVYMKTATEVGGDYYDFIVGLDGTLTVAIGDATGHGMKAGTIVSMTKALFAAGGSNLDMKTYFNQSSAALKGIELGRLMMAFIMLKIKANKLVFANAGMPSLFIYRNKTREVEETILHGMPLGAMKNFPYEIKETEISSGDTILLLSDGLPELKNEKNEQYDYARVKEEFKSAAEKSPNDIVEYMKSSASKWSNGIEPDDDVTFVVIKIR